MDKRTRRRKRRNAIKETMDIVKTILLVVIAVAAVVFVVLFIKGQIGGTADPDSKMSVFGDIFTGKETTEAATEQTSGDMEIETELKDGFNKDSEGRLIYVADGTVRKNQWMDLNRSLYRIDAEGFVKTGSFEEDGFIYETSEQGAVTAIRWNENYADPSPAAAPGLVKSGSLQVYLNSDVTLGRFSAITYKKSSVSHLLGGENDPQYTRAGSIQTDQEGYIYWLPAVTSPDEMEKRINRKLYRRLPEGEVRQIVAEDVDGYRVVSAEGAETVIYYCKGSGMYRCGSANCKDDVAVVRFTEDMEYKLDLSTEGKLYLKTSGGYPVTQAFDSFRTGGMNYKISETGEILSREDQIKVVIGVDLYSILSDEVFGTIRSVVVREDGEGTKAMISSEFIGECRCIYYNEKDGRMYAEYVFSDGSPHVAMITKDGDVDLLISTEEGLETMEIFGFTTEGVVVKKTDIDGKVSYSVVSSGDSTPLAIAIDPQPVSGQSAGNGSETASVIEQYGPGYTGTETGAASSSSSQGPGNVSIGGPGSSIQAPSGLSSQPGVTVPNGGPAGN